MVRLNRPIFIVLDKDEASEDFDERVSDLAPMPKDVAAFLAVFLAIMIGVTSIGLISSRRPLVPHHHPVVRIAPARPAPAWGCWSTIDPNYCSNR